MRPKSFLCAIFEFLIKNVYLRFSKSTHFVPHFVPFKISRIREKLVLQRRGSIFRAADGGPFTDLNLWRLKVVLPSEGTVKMPFQWGIFLFYVQIGLVSPLLSNLIHPYHIDEFDVQKHYHPFLLK